MSKRGQAVPARTHENSERIVELERELASLCERNQELTDFFENGSIGLHWVGPDGTVLWANQAELDLLGYERDEYIGHHIAEFHADIPVIEDILRRLQARETLQDYEARLRSKTGEIRYVLINSNVLWDGDRFVHTRCFTRDVSDRILAREELKQANQSLKALAEEARAREELFRLALRNSAVVVFYQDTDLRYKWVYNPFPEHVGIPLVNKLDSEFFPPDQVEQFARIKLGVLASGKGVRQDVAVTSQAGTRIMDTRFEPYWDSSGKIAGVLGVAVDVTDGKRKEKELADSREQLRGLVARLQAAREKDRELSSHDVHDIAQRLAALGLELAMVTGGFAESAPNVVAERLNAVSRTLAAAVESSARISTDLRPSLLDNLGLANTLEWYGQEFASRTGIRLISETLKDVRLDRDVGAAIFRIFQDILNNVERHSHATEVHLRMCVEDRRLIIEVSDNGMGIDHNKLRDPRSLGLLAMRELALLFGGKIGIQSARDMGTTVVLDVPLDARMSNP
jgi:PAS domain S-box-containing protein